MRFRLQATKTNRCSALSHVYQNTTRGEPCHCGQRRWGIEPERRVKQWLDAKGRVYRKFWRCIAQRGPNRHHPDYWVYVCRVHGCGHIIVKRTETKASWSGVNLRCRMCEMIYTELEQETKRIQAQTDKRRQKEMRDIQKLLARKRLVVRVQKDGSRSRGPKRKPKRFRLVAD